MASTDANNRSPATSKPRKRIVKATALLSFAVLAAIGTALLLTRYMDARTAAARVPTTRVVVAAVDVPVATAIRPEWLTIVDWPSASRPEGVAQDPAALVDRVALVPITKGEPVLDGKLAQPGARGGLATLVPEGFRAVAVRVDDVVGVAGFIHPGDRVDVIATMASRAAGEPVAKVILQNVKVLAVGKDVQSKGRDAEKAVAATVATLMVSPEESESLALGATKGKLLLTLRGLGDEDVAETEGATAAVLLAAAAPPPKASAAAPAKPTAVRGKKAAPAKVATSDAPQQKQTVEILRGDLFEKRDFNKAEAR